MTDQNPFLHFNFADKAGSIRPLTFSNADKVIMAWKPEEVIPCLQIIDQAPKEGNYAGGYISYGAAPAFHPNLHATSGKRMPLFSFGILPEPDAQCKHTPENKQFQTGIWHREASTDNYYKI